VDIGPDSSEAGVTLYLAMTGKQFDGISQDENDEMSWFADSLTERGGYRASDRYHGRHMKGDGAITHAL
jgi:hypothetical protein